ncbi:phosphoenolpyruvate--protein phosphotransferase [Alicyclobacillus sendaiensis]|uniref:Phosphoenolpyruvate-protein phosphotransferase n=1 Tax=Alicyclobacillus sendaiensis PA2 TaxID=3029425 RepID=A0ABT6XZV7_ALISE|nr:phosphoenolpyruvate--protein phosphotransferase [Alicyclobacillus sendaiensis]MDI9260600.1 phosphoenolpyruvate--protein phosphotransferase [Alicyclobacillus sendaiensis PA2]
MSTVYRGVAASDGVAVAKAFVLDASEPSVERVEVADPEAEWARVEGAIAAAKEELESLRRTALDKLGESEAQLFVAHAQMLEDPELTGQIRQAIEAERVNAEWAVKSVIDTLVGLFDALDDEYMRQRAADVRDVGSRLLRHLQGGAGTSLAELAEPVVLVARDLAPSDTVQLNPALVRAFVTDIGGRTSHTAIMARSLGIPAVVGLGDITARVESGQVLAVDGTEGLVVVQPDENELRRFSAQVEKQQGEHARLAALRDAESVTPDGRRVEIAGNIGTPAEVAQVLAQGGEGIGLFRSEFLYMNRDTAPTEEEQFAAYKEVAEAMQGRPVIVRTLDVGGDKSIPYLGLPREDNPFLGYRAIRVCLDQKELFAAQLRAILRASHYGKLRVMFPMIATVEEVRAAKRELEAAKQALRAEGVPFDEEMEVGIMIEIPAAAVMADRLAKEVDFFSIGTNDLVQYALACDRLNERISHLYQPLNPSVLRLVKMVIDGAHAAGKWVGMCGELAGDPRATAILLGLGLDEFSMSAGSILQVRDVVRNTRYEDAKALAARALEADTEADVLRLVQG